MEIKIFDWIKNFLWDEGNNSIDLRQSRIDSISTKIAIEEFALATGINLIAGTISKCKFKTYLNNKENESDEYYLWNIEPNRNQNSSEFIQELISKLIVCNECLVFEVGGEIFVADGFTKEKFATKEEYFTNVNKNGLSFNKTFYMNEVLYFKWNCIEVKTYLDKIMNGYNELINLSIGKYTRSGGRKGIVKTNTAATGNKDFKNQVDALFNESFKTYFNSENAVLNLPNGVDYNESESKTSKTTSEVNDIQNLLKESFDRVSQALKIPPALLKGEIADISKVTDNYLTFGIDPLVSMLEEEIIRKRYGKKEYLKGNYIKIDTTSIKHIDVFSIAEKIDKLIASGTYNIDEIRSKLGDSKVNEDFSKKHFITKNYQDVNDLEGGEKNGETNVGSKTTSGE